MSTSDLKTSSNSFEQDEEAVYVLFAASQLAGRTNSPVTIDFFLAGLYLVAFNRLSPYFYHSERVARFVASQYGLTLPIWVYWSQLCAAIDCEKECAMHRLTQEVQELLSQAARSASLHHRRISVLDFCFAISESKVEACRKFIASGIDIARMLGDAAKTG